MIFKKIAFIFCCLFIIAASYSNPLLNVDYKYEKDLRIAQVEVRKTKKFFKDRFYFVDDIKINIKFIHYIKTKGKGKNKQYWNGWYDLDTNMIHITSSNIVFPFDRLGIHSRNGPMRHEIAHAIFFKFTGCKSIPEHEYIAAVVEISGYPKKERDRLIKLYIRSDYDSYFRFCNEIRKRNRAYLYKLSKIVPEYYHVYSYMHDLDMRGYTFNDLMNNGEF